MKKKTLIMLSLLFGVCLTFFACRKEIDNYLHDRTGPSSDILESAKIWRLQNLQYGKKLALAPSQILKPYWNDSWTVKLAKGDVYLIVPTGEHFMSNKDVKIRRYFIFTANGGKISSGIITELVGHKFDITSSTELLVRNNGREIPGFNGSIIQYDINYRKLGAISYVNGKKSNSQVDIINKSFREFSASARSGGAGGSGGKLMLGQNQNITMTGDAGCDPVTPTLIGIPTGLAQDCILTLEHEWTMVDGCIVAESYRYIGHRCPGDSTSGNGSGSGSGSGTGTSDGNPDYGGSGSSGSVVQTILNNLEDACKKAALTKITDTKIKNYVTSFYNKFLLPTSSPITVTFKEGANLTVNGNPAVAYSTSPQEHTWEISFSSNYYAADTSNHVTQEAWGIIIAHELIHVAIKENNLNVGASSNDHLIMFKNFVEPMRDLMKSAFGLNDAEATKMALSGMKDLWGFSDYDALSQSTYGFNNSQVDATYNKYVKGQGGIRCGN